MGPKLELTLKVGALNTQRFQTVVPYIDPRTVATWGPVESPQQTRDSSEQNPR